jgi:acyl transferase domain-containing protein/acyl carrier protein
MSDQHDEIAIIGMSGRFPGANNIDEFWRNLVNGVESITMFTAEELEAAGIDSATARHPNYVRAGGVLDGVELFDASFFGFTPREAAIMDPQHRHYLECSWEAMENSGYDPDQFGGRIGVFAGVSINKYLFYLFANPALMQSVDAFTFTIMNDKDFVPTRVSYEMNLKGPSVNVQTACSTSLVAVCLACQSLLDGECEMAMAGSSSIKLPQKIGWFYQEGGVLSPDGHCRAFDASAAGTVGGRGVAVVVLKRLVDALADGDTIYAVIKGFAVNNDGAEKIGYTAPSVAGQAAVITEALSMAGVNPETITYVEAHGTGTSLGDPIEVTALTQAFRASTNKKGYCAIGSLKTNIGHTDTTAGVAGLIKTALAIKHKMVPPSLNFERPNPQIDFENSPFFVNTKLLEWKSDAAPIRAGVSSFGIGGTNAHVVLEEAPTVAAGTRSRVWQTLMLSAKTETALDQAALNLAQHLRKYPETNLADAAYTLKLGRKTFAYRRVVTCQSHADAIEALETGDPQRCFDSIQKPNRRPVAFMFPGGGAQYVGMARELYSTENVFKDQLDRCAEILEPLSGFNLLDYLYRTSPSDKAATQQMQRTSVGLPALFAVEYALAKLWMSWGIRPAAMIGHSLGEYTAACLAGVFSVKDALALITRRGQLLEELPSGSMISVSLPEDQVRALVDGKLSVAAINGPAQCVVSGLGDAIEEIAAVLTKKNVEFRTIHIAAAGHSVIVEPILERFTAFAQTLDLRPPQRPYISNVTGDWITPDDATNPSYWARHLRLTVRFAEGMSRIMEEPEQVLLEVGPGQILSTLAKLQPEDRRARSVITSMRHPYDVQSDDMYLQVAVGKLWLAGVDVDWPVFYTGESRRRIPLPSYPFERQRYWVDPQRQAATDGVRQTGLARKTDIADWFYIPSWQRTMPPQPLREGKLRNEKQRWMVFGGESELDADLIERLLREEQDVVRVSVGDGFRRTGVDTYEINPRSPDGYAALIKELAAQERLPQIVVSCWNVSEANHSSSNAALFKAAETAGYLSLLYLAQALDREAAGVEMLLLVLANNLHDVLDHEKACPEKVTLLGPCKVIPQEYPNLACRSIDIETPTDATRRTALIDQLLGEARMKSTDVVVAYRGKQRLVQSFEKVRLESDGEQVRSLRDRGVYIISGGLGRVGLLLASHLARTHQARLALFSRSAFPARDEWEQWLAEHEEEDSVSRKIKQLLGLEELGSEVLVSQADVADESQLELLFQRVEERFGEIHGVIHAAGIMRGESFLRPLAEIGAVESEAQFAAKVYGTYALEQVLRQRKPDFCLLLSSNASVLGGLGFVNYAAANLFLDAFAADRNKESRFPWISSNWDGWLPDEAMPKAMRTSMDEYAMTPRESCDAFERLVTQATVSQVVVSPGDLFARLDLWIYRRSNLKNQPVEEEEIPAFQSRPNLRSGYVGPRDETEERLNKIWRKLLGIEQIGINDNFFELGGHSLLATQVMSQVRDAFEIEISLRSIFEAPTVAGLAERVAQVRAAVEQTPEESPGPPLIPVSRDRELPLSFAQQRLWFLDQLEPGNPAYNLPVAVRLRGELEVGALARTFNEIRHRHEVLRTAFITREGRAVQEISGQWEEALPVVDLTELSKEAREQEARRLAQRAAQERFDLRQAPLMRVRLLRLRAREHLLLLVMHHIVSDGWSMGILVREVSELYGAYRRGESGALGELPIQYGDYAVWQREYLGGAVLEQQLGYWREQLQGVGVLELPTDHVRPAVQSYRGGHEAVWVSAGVSEKLQELSRSEGATLYMTLLAAFKVLLYLYSGARAIVVGSPVAGRNRTEVEGLIGFFINTLVLRSEVSGAESFRAMLRREREVVLEAYAHQEVPFEKLVEELQPERSLSHSPLFQVWFVLQNLQTPSTPARELPDLTLSPMRLVSEVARHDLRLDINETPKGLAGSFQYSTDLFEASTVARMAREFEALTQAIAENPDARLNELKEVLAEKEKHERMTKAKEFEAADRQSLKRLKRSRKDIQEAQRLR